MAANTWAGDAALAPVNRRQTTWRRGLTSAERLWALYYRSAVINKFPCLPIAVNVNLFRALLLSNFFMHKGRLNKALLIIFILSWEERP
jgi:hypothetical protein